jgi:hypothetical protein
MKYVLLTSPYTQPWVTDDEDPYLTEHPSMYTIVGTFDTPEQADIAHKELILAEYHKFLDDLEKIALEELSEADYWDGDDTDKINY